MVQSLNTRAIVTLASVFRRPSLLVPHLTVEDVSQIDYYALKKDGRITAVVFDKDNTLTEPYNSNEIHPDAVAGLKQAQEVFGRSNVAILSNSAGTDDDYNFEDATKIEQSLGIAVIRHQEKKPGGMKEVLQHFQQWSSLDDSTSSSNDNNNNNGNDSSSSSSGSASVSTPQLCVIGDRLLTDVVFGNLHGALTVHTMPLCKTWESNAKDNLPAKVIRWVENFFMYRTPIGRYLLRNCKPKHKFWTSPPPSPSPP